MRLARVAHGNRQLPALVLGKEVALLDSPELATSPNRALEVLCSSPKALTEVAASVTCVPLDRSALLSPVSAPGKIFAVGLNYADHISEAELEVPNFPAIFAKSPNSLNGPFSDVQLPRVSQLLDYEESSGS